MKDPMVELLNQLDQEVQAIDDESERAAAAARLEEAMVVYSGEDRTVSFKELADEMEKRPEEEKLLTGIRGLDTILKGFRKNQLIVLAAPTKSGKTQFCIELTIRLKEANPLWIPFEESAEELIQKFLDRGEQPPHAFTPKIIKEQTLKWVEEKIVEAKVKYNSRIVFIDHLHFLIPFNSDRMDTRIGHTMRTLKTIAKNHGVTIIIVSHLKKTNMLVSPTLEDLRDSSFTAQEADTVILLWRKTHKEDTGEVVISNQTLLSIQANRRTGTTGNVKLNFKDGRYFEEDWKHQDIENESW